jgi:hypothetical protein
MAERLNMREQKEKQHVTIKPTRITSVKLKYFIAGLLEAGVSEDILTETLDWAEGLIELDPAQYRNNEVVMRLAARF